MAKLRDEAVTAADLQRFVESKADFAFEMRVLRRFEELGYTCEHGGTYRDPITDKIRQFDIRAHRRYGSTVHLAIAAECKNIGKNFPLLVHAVPRKAAEAFHTLVVSDGQHPSPRARPVRGDLSRYRPGVVVGKRLDQVGRAAAGGDVVSSDQEVFEKVSQSVNSTVDLLHAIAASGVRPALHAIVPLLVVPDGRLWLVEYSSAGEQKGVPRPVDACTVFLDQEWSCTTLHHDQLTYRLSHFEITALGALKNTLRVLWEPTDYTSGLFLPTARELSIEFNWP